MNENDMSMRDLVTVFAYNKMLDNAINACGKDRHDQPFDLAISNTLQPYVCEKVLPYFSRNRALMEVMYQPKLLAKEWSLDNVYS